MKAAARRWPRARAPSRTRRQLASGLLAAPARRSATRLPLAPAARARSDSTGRGRHIPRNESRHETVAAGTSAVESAAPARQWPAGSAHAPTRRAVAARAGRPRSQRLHRSRVEPAAHHSVCVSMLVLRRLARALQNTLGTEWTRLRGSGRSLRVATLGLPNALEMPRRHQRRYRLRASNAAADGSSSSAGACTQPCAWPGCVGGAEALGNDLCASPRAIGARREASDGTAFAHQTRRQTAAARALHLCAMVCAAWLRRRRRSALKWAPRVTTRDRRATGAKRWFRLRASVAAACTSWSSDTLASTRARGLAASAAPKCSKMGAALHHPRAARRRSAVLPRRGRRPWRWRQSHARAHWSRRPQRVVARPHRTSRHRHRVCVRRRPCENAPPLGETARGRSARAACVAKASHGVSRPRTRWSRHRRALRQKS